MRISKKITFLAVGFCLILSSAFSVSVKEAELFGEITSAYSKKSYPIAADSALQFEKLYPNSSNIGQVLLIEGKSLCLTKQSKKAVETLTRTFPYCGKDSQELLECYYYLAKANYDCEEYLNAATNYLNTCELYNKYTKLQTEENKYYFDKSVFCGGLSFYKYGNVDKAIPNFEYVVKNGTSYSQKDYEECLIDLFECYYASDKYKKAFALYNSLVSHKENFSSKAFCEITMTCGDCYAEADLYRKAYELYISVLSLADSNYASKALLKAYEMSSQHRKEVKEDPGSILQTVKDKFKDSPEFLSEFWIRLAIDAYDNGEVEKSKQYFANAQEQNDNKDFDKIKALYLANLESEKKVEYLENCIKTYEITSSDPLYYDYQVEKLKLYLSEGNYDKCISNGNKLLSELKKDDSLKSLYAHAVYYISYSYYQINDKLTALYTINKICPFKDTSYLSENFVTNTTCFYGKVLILNGKSADAKKAFETLKIDSLSKKDKLTYAQALFLEGYIGESLKIAEADSSSDGLYLSGLCQFNKQDWTKAERYFTKFLNSNPTKNLDWGTFYVGYCKYKNGKTSDCYSWMTKFCNDYPNHSMIFDASIIASTCALQGGYYDDGIHYAENAVIKASGKAQKEKAVLLVSSIYEDSGEYDKALTALKPFLQDNSEFGLQSRFKAAELNGKLGLTSEADKIYNQIISFYPNTTYSQEASYRRGELYYYSGDYTGAITRFTDYQKKYPYGKYVDSSYFYLADSWEKNQDLSKAVMYYRALIQINPDSPYIYASRKALVNIYKNQQNYNEALNQVKLMQQDFPEESRKEKMSEVQRQLEKLASGEDEQILVLQTSYEEKGKETSKAGRIIGTDLAEELNQHFEYQEQAYELAKTLYSVQSKSSNIKSEGKYAVRTLTIISSYLRIHNQNEEAAKNYLECALLARENGNELIASKSLYCAIEAYVACGLKADAKAVQEKLVEWYGDSDYAKAAESLIK